MRRPEAESAQRRALVMVAAGSGERLGYGVPKAQVELSGRSILAHALDAVRPELGIAVVVLVLPGDPAAYRELSRLGADLAASQPVEVIITDGGPSRLASVGAGVDSVVEHARAQGWDPAAITVLIHDAARPLTPSKVHQRVAGAVEAGEAAVVPAVPVTDTVKRVSRSESVIETLPRAQLRAVQTPQGFTLDFLRQAFARIGELAEQDAELLTDEAMMAEDMGVDVVVVAGDPLAVKITTETDLIAAEALLNRDPAPHSPRPDAPRPRSAPRRGSSTTAATAAPRIGIGHDIHAFAAEGESRELWLAGLHWPGERGLTGHSDGDAVAHACCDALFSAAGLGDMGVHFGADTIGTSRPELEGSSGVALLAEAARIVRETGFEVGNIAVQFVGRRPRFAPRRDEAHEVLSRAAGASVSVSATTSDGLGFTGRSEGVVATATAVLLRG